MAETESEDEAPAWAEVIARWDDEVALVILALAWALFRDASTFSWGRP